MDNPLSEKDSGSRGKKLSQDQTIKKLESSILIGIT